MALRQEMGNAESKLGDGRMRQAETGMTKALLEGQVSKRAMI
jgi:hypothetical protein